MAGIKQEDIQPGDMKVWTDPFDRPGNQGLNLHEYVKYYGTVSS